MDSELELQELPLHDTEATPSEPTTSKPRKRVSFEDNTYFVIEEQEPDDDLQDQSPAEEGWVYTWFKQFANALNPTIDYTQVKKAKNVAQPGDAVVNLRSEARALSGEQQGTTVLSKAHLHGQRTQYLFTHLQQNS